MPSVNIQITADETGAAPVIENVKAQLSQVQSASSSAFNGLTNDQTKAMLAARALNQELGIEAPRAIQSLIAQSQSLGPIMAAAFSAVPIIFMVQSLISGLPAIAKYIDGLRGINDQLDQQYQLALRINKINIGPQDVGDITKQNASLLQDLATQQATVNAGSLNWLYGEAPGGPTNEELDAAEKRIPQIQAQLDALAPDLASAQRQTDELAIHSAKAMADIADSSETGYDKVVADATAAVNEQLALEAKHLQSATQTAYNLTQIYAQMDKGIDTADTQQSASHAKAMADIADSSKTGFDKINADEAASIAYQQSLQDAQIGDWQEHQDKITEIEATAAQARNKLWDSIYNPKTGLIATNAAALTTYLEKDANDQAKDVGQAGAQELLNEQKRGEQQLEIDKTILSAEEDYQIARLQYEGDTVGAIIVQEQYRMEQQIDLLIKYGATEDQIQQARVALWSDANVHIATEFRSATQQMGSDLVSLFDDIGNGDLGNRLLKNFETLLAQMVAAWLISTQAMQGSLGQMLSGIIFGPGTSTAQYFGGSTGVLGLSGLLGGGSAPTSASSSSASLLGLGSLFGGSSATIPSLAGSSSSATGSSDFLSLFGGSIPGVGGSSFSNTSDFASPDLLPGSVTTDVAASASTTPNDVLSQSLLSLAGGGGSVGSIPVMAATKTASSGLSSLLSMGTVGALLPLLAGYAGDKLGGTTGAIGAGIAGLVAAGSLGYGPLAGAIGFYGSTAGLLAGPVAGGLLGFGVGEQYGPAAGGISGAGAGALTGLLAFGPVGALIGGIVGLLGGLFGGLFGGSKRKAEAQSFYQSESSQIDTIFSDYESYQTDYADATSQLEQIRSYSQQQLDALKGEGKSAFNQQLSPYIDKIEQEMKSDEDERNRSSTLLFGPPQFASGGVIGGGRTAGWGLGGGAVLMVGHEGEGVLTRQAMQKNPGIVDRLNNGGTAGGDIHLNVTAIDAKSFLTFLRTGGSKALAEEMRRAAREGGF